MLKARKNNVEIIKLNGEVRVRKTYCGKNLAPNLFCTEFLEGKMPVAKLIERTGNECVYEYFGDKNLLDFLEESEKANDPTIFLDKAKTVLIYLEKFYTLTKENAVFFYKINKKENAKIKNKEPYGDIVLNDVNFRNFVFNYEDVACIDFDEVGEGEVIEELASFIAYLMSYSPIATKFKINLAFMLKEYIYEKFGFDNKNFLPYIYSELEKINSRRKEKLNCILLTNCLLSNVLLCPDSFKGTMSATEVVEIIKTTIKNYNDNTEVVEIPMADGGEGTLELFKRFTDCRYVTKEITNSKKEKTVARYLLDKDYAIIESAEAVGLDRFSGTTPDKATTCGVGELMLDAIGKDAKTIYLAVGGTSTNDLGTGIAYSLGVNFYSKTGRFMPDGDTLDKIIKVETSDKKDIRIVCMTDVRNPLFGEKGSAYVYAKQKGATEQIVEKLENNAIEFDKFLVGKSIAKADTKYTEGVGAGGGIPYSLIVFFDAKIESGIDAIIKLSSFCDKAKECDLVITGEGKLDIQSFMGKVLDGILKNTPIDKKVISIAGKIDIAQSVLTEKGLYFSISVNKTQNTIEKIKLTAKTDLENAVKEMYNTVKLF